MAVPITPVELIYGLRLRVKTVHGQFTIADTLLGVVQLVTNMDLFLVGCPLRSLDCHAYRTFGFKLVFRQPSCIAPRWHILYERPKVQCISVISHDFFTQLSGRGFLYFPDLCFAGFMVAMKNDTRPACVVVFNEVIEVAVCLIEETKHCMKCHV